MKKFRAWDVENKIMIPNENYFLSLDEKQNFIVCIKNREYGESGELKHQPKIIVMQFTGLLDKNGVEIYEGDILKFNKPTDQTSSQYKKTTIVSWDKKRNGYKLPYSYLMYAKVIGNIYRDGHITQGD